jgi:hypothetical protein
MGSMSSMTRKQLAAATTALLGVFAFQSTAAAEQNFQKLTGAHERVTLEGVASIERRSSCQLSLPLSLCCSVFVASLQRELNNRRASSVESNNKRVRKIIPQRHARLNTTYA